MSEHKFDKALVDRVKEFFNSGEQELKFDQQMSPTYLYDLAVAAGGDPCMDEGHTNGYQIDYWIPCDVNGVKYCLHGSAWYGNAEIYKDDE